MKKQTLLSLALTVFFSASTAHKTFAQPVTSPNLLTQNQVTVIPESTALIVSFPNAIDLNISQNQNYTTTLPLVQPILDSTGNILVPQYSPVVVQLVPYEDNVAIVAKSIVIKGKVVPIEAVSPTIFGTTITEVSGREKAQENIAPFGTLFGSVLGAIDGDLKTEYQASKGGVALGIIAGLVSSKKVRIVNIPQGSIHVLTLQEPIDLVKINPISERK